MKETSRTLIETEAIAQGFLATLTSSTTATVVALQGDLGAGKTAFTKACAKLLGIREEITSPTFVIEKVYKLEHKNFSHLIHIDAYRLESSKELLTLGWNEQLQNSQNLIFIEWPEIVKDILPENVKTIKFEFIDEATRTIEIEN